MVVAALQEVHTKLSQEESDVEGGASLIFALAGLTVPLGNSPHGLSRVVSIVFELEEKTESCCKTTDHRRDEWRENRTHIVHVLVINHIFVSNGLEALDDKRSSESRVPAERKTMFQASLDLDKLHFY